MKIISYSHRLMTCTCTAVVILTLSTKTKLSVCDAMRIAHPWTTKHWCNSVRNPSWPFSYSKYKNQLEEIKGRTSTNEQDMRHECESRGVQSKCHICEDIVCGNNNQHNNNDGASRATSSSPSICHFQIQGVNWHELSRNIPTVTDVPWAVGGNHRYDFGGNDKNNHTSHVCLYLSGSSPCRSAFGTDYSNCKLRCWGANSSSSLLQQQPDSVGWEYPKAHVNEGRPRNPKKYGNLTTVQQGYTFTLAGGDEEGFMDGFEHEARFRHPEGVAVDREGYVYVADTGNHAIRAISPSGNVITLAGTGAAGSKDGFATDAQFSSPSSIAVWYDWQWWPYEDPDDPDSVLYRNGDGALVLFVTDTGNHRIRKLTFRVIYDADGAKQWQNVHVECFAGKCGNDNNEPLSGYADGEASISRFDSPRGIAVSSIGDVFVADANNHLIRKIDRYGVTRILAGAVEVSETNDMGEPQKGCPYPCLTGRAGYLDGGWNLALFDYPYDIAIDSEEKSLWITDRHFVRKFDFDSMHVSTIAGSLAEGERDGEGRNSSFQKPTGVTVTSNGIAYVTDSVSCRIRRLPPSAARPITCSDTLLSLIRPSGCSSYDHPTDENGLMATPVESNIYRNFVQRDEYSSRTGFDIVGRGIKNCVGSPPRDALDKRFWNASLPNYPYNENLVIDDHLSFTREDPNVGTLVKTKCPGLCGFSLDVRGGEYHPKSAPENFVGLYDEMSSICGSAIHSGIIDDAVGGFVEVVIERGRLVEDDGLVTPSFRNGITPGKLETNATRLISMTAGSGEVGVQTISGAPVTLLGNGCDFRDAIPPQEAKFGTPIGIGAFVNASLNDNVNFLVIADRNNHAIRAMSAVCSYVCENGGRCIGPDQCKCLDGWGGEDCTAPICASPCGERELCVSPNTCKCIPGYRGEGKGCNEPLCVQECYHGGICSAPDTCSCLPGWFDANCTTPVCEQTCGNGGNCTAPNTCSCPSEWIGSDCRTPVCHQQCLNGGWCVSPDTCLCPPQWSGHDCSLPVCHQGFFQSHSMREKANSNHLTHWLSYQPCNITAWCIETNGFDCAQDHRAVILVKAKYGREHRHITGRKVFPDDCAMIELGVNATSHYQYLSAWNHKKTTNHRYSPKAPYDWISQERKVWNGFIEPADNYTQPWSYTIDRQVALASLRNISLGKYICANGGSCVAPDTCSCAPGWIGFDCRTPVCTEGFFEPDQESFVEGTNLPNELEAFDKFLGNNTYRLDPGKANGRGYSNPNVTIWVEKIMNATTKIRYNATIRGTRYLSTESQNQGGYSCSIRSVTEWENYRSGFILEHPNYFSRYMDAKVEINGESYSHWEGMNWIPTHKKSGKLIFEGSDLKLEYSNMNVEERIQFVYTDEGYRKYGQWSLTGAPWTKGSCILEFKRVCENEHKAVDLEAGSGNGMGVTQNKLLVQDTDKSFRARITYDDKKSYARGRWFQDGGECVDHVVRGCFNNGTCVAPDVCQCAAGWSGHDCSIPMCLQECKHNGNCTLPNVCTCEKGWTGIDCAIPMCVQSCNNGKCIAPDVCQCDHWESEWRDGQTGGGAPIYRKPNGDPQMTGWTGFDCSTPICVQAERFRLNVDVDAYSAEEISKVLFPLGGHGLDGNMIDCDMVRCPVYDEMLTMNNGRSFQTGCGYDPVYTGCCELDGTYYRCLRCRRAYLDIQQHHLTCNNNEIEIMTYSSYEAIPLIFRDDNRAIKMCDSPLNQNDISVKLISDKFLCNRHVWVQGDFIDAAELEGAVGVGSDYGLSRGRHIRINFNNYLFQNSDTHSWKAGEVIEGEGIFECYNFGSCIAPDTCTCMDGWTEYNCNTPMCRHEQVDGLVVGCLNDGVCENKDQCQCIQTASKLWEKYDVKEGGLTGYTGTDCSMPICLQGFFDPLCDSPGGEGCFHCANGGKCVAPDTCECPENWIGFDCRTPVCKVEATPVIREQLMTEDNEKIKLFEENPCSLEGIYAPEIIDGKKYFRGKCILPNKCACFCKKRLNGKYCKKYGGGHCKNPFQDPLYQHRDVLAPNELFGTRNCWSGYEGAVDDNDDFISCHMTVVEPKYVVEKSVDLIVWGSISLVVTAIFYLCIRRAWKKKQKSDRIRRRQERRNLAAAENAFTHRETLIDFADEESEILTGRRPTSARPRSRARYTMRNR